MALAATGRGEAAILRLLRGDRATRGRARRPAGRRGPGGAPALAARSCRPRRRHRRPGDRGVPPSTSRRTTRSGGRSPSDREPRDRRGALVARLPLRRPRRLRRRPGAEPARPVARGRLRRASTRCGSAAGRTRPRRPTLLARRHRRRRRVLAADGGEPDARRARRRPRRRADGLAELWNEWGRVRPLLLDRPSSVVRPASPATLRPRPPSMTTARSASAAATPIALPPSSAHSRIRSLQRSGVADLARVRAQGRDLAVDRRADVDPGVRLRSARTGTAAGRCGRPARRGRATGTPSGCGPPGRRRRPPPSRPPDGRCG